MAKRKASTPLAAASNRSMATESAPVATDERFAPSSEESGPDSGEESASDSEAEPSDADEDSAAHRRNVKRKANPISAAEVRAAREASETFRSNVFKLQVEEVLKEISVDEKYAQMARKLLFSVREAIAATAPVKPVPFSQIPHVTNTRLPFPAMPEAGEIRYKFAYAPPALDDINVTGSWSLHTTVRRPARSVGIDLYVPMADSLFDDKDYQDFRYHRKRAFFLAVLAGQLAEHAGLHVEPRFERFNGHPLRPVLQLVPVGPLARLAKRACIYVHVGPASPDRFAFARLARHRNANRAVDGATPVYNWSVVADQCVMPALRYLHATAAVAPAFADAAKLGALWLQQRRWASDPTKGGFGAFELTMVMAALLNGGAAHGKKRLLPGYSSYQLLKGTLLYIAESPHIALEAALLDRSQPTVPGAEPGLYFRDCGLDVLANLAPWAPKLLRHDAELAVDMLGDGTRDRFESLFLRDAGTSKHLRFDVTFEVKLPAAAEHSPVQAIAAIAKLLDAAWGPRYRAMLITPATEVVQGSLQASWALASDPPSDHARKFTVGAVLDPAHANKRVTFVGPEVDDSPEEFKRLWGARASLRRFQDGTIRDAVVWPQTAKPVVQEAAEYVLGQHLHAAVAAPKPLERMLSSASVSPEGATAGFTALATSFQKLGQTLQELRGALPLRILSVYGTSANLRSASLDLPVPFVPQHLAEGVIELESSAKWPRDLEAAEKVKSAFLIKIAESFRKLHPQYYVVIGLEPSPSDPAVEASFATIQSPEGFYFKLRIASRSLATQPLADLVDHTRLITTMVHRYGAALSATMRLVKLWLEKQLLMSHVTEPAAELLALAVFVNSAPWAPPASGTTGFWRVLDLLARWDWREQPQILDVDRKVEDDELDGLKAPHLVTGCDTELALFQSMTAAFVKQRKQDPALTQAPWIIPTKLDVTGTKWTAWEPRSRIAAVIAARVTALAQAAAPGTAVFKPALSDFDVAWSVRGPARSTSKHKNIAVSDPQNAIIGAHNVTLDLVKALKRIYRDSLVLFYSGELGEDPEGGAHTLCGIWNRAALDPLPKLKANIPFPVRQTKKGFELDKESVIQEIERLGTGMLKRRH